MSKNRTSQNEIKPNPKEPQQSRQAAPISPNNSQFNLPVPWLWLMLAALIVYFPSFQFGLTELDDTIFIRDFHSYNEDLHNLVTSFHRGLFDAVKDPYYRPLFMDSMILNYQLSDHGMEIMSYHVVNVLLHMTCVLLLYKLFLKLEIKALQAFILAAVFAVHPVLSQAVAWIPGRNDTLLAIFVFSFLIATLDYSNEGKVKSLVMGALFLLLAYFTKETAVFAAPVAFVLLTGIAGKKWNEKNSLVMYGMWAACFLIWYGVRASATVQTNISAAQVFHDFVPRLPLIVQYLGKVVLPVNLSVFPIQEDTVYYWGIAALILLAAIVVLNKQRKLTAVLSGAGVFLLFLLPVLFVPNKLNEQAFEHRLYLPMLGILLLLPQTILLRNRLQDKQLLAGAAVVCALLATVNFRHQKAFEDKMSFWTEAVETSPHSAFANMMLGARLDKEDFERSCNLFRTAYKLNPNEKYLNFYLGVMLQKKDSVLQSERYLLAEKNGSGYYECDFYLARVAMEKKDLNGAIASLETYLKRDPTNNIANSNLLLLYLDTRQPEKAKAHIMTMKQAGLPVQKEFLQRVGM